MYISGIGRTKFGILQKSLPELLYEAMLKAINDSSLKIQDIDAIVAANYLGDSAQNQLHLGSLISALLPGTNLPSFRVEAACASGGIALYNAQFLIKKFDNILIIGGEKLNDNPQKYITKKVALAGEHIRDQQEGMIFPAQYAIIASEYFKKYFASSEDLARISLKNYGNAKLNPFAHFNYKDLTLDTITSSLPVCSPLRLFDCCPISDGAAALVLSKNKISNRDVKIIGSSVTSDAISLSQRKEFTAFKATRLAAKIAYKKAKISPKDVDIAEVHDCFTIAELIAMEDLGFCRAGEGIHLIKEEMTSLSGRIPINSDGGLLADGHPIGATGIAQVCEIIKQLRGEAEKGRQIANPRIGLAHNVGGAGGTAVVHILERCE